MKKITSFWFSFLVILWILISLLSLILLIISLVTKVHAQGLGNCNTGWVFKAESEPFGVGMIHGSINKVIVKAGSQNQGDACFEFTADGDDGCYRVSGFGTDLVSVQKIGGGRDCKDISHVEFYAEEVTTPTPEPSVDPSPTPSIDPSPSATPSASPTVSPEPSPMSTPSPVLLTSPQPTSTPTVEQQTQIIHEELIKEYGKIPEIGFK